MDDAHDVAAVVISGGYSFHELKYALRADTVDATVQRMYEYTVPARHGRSRPRLAVEYAFNEANGRQRQDKESVALPSALQGAATVRVQVLPGPHGDSRLEVNRSHLGPGIFGISLAIVVLSLARMIRDAHAPIPHRPRKSLP